MYSFSKTVTKSFKIKSESDRIVEGIVSAEIVDKQGEITIRDALLDALKTMVTNTKGAMTDTHSNRVVGQWFNFEPIDIIDKDGIEIAAIKGTGRIFKGAELFDKIWERVKNGEYKGFSFGGAMKEGSTRIPITQKDGKVAYQLKDLEVYEVAICPEPAVPWALVTDFNKLAKSYSQKEIGEMHVMERDDGQLIVQCDRNVCYVNQSVNDVENPNIVAQSQEMLNRGKASIKTKDMTNEEKIKNEEEEQKESKEESKDEDKDKSTVRKEESKEEESKESENEDKDKSIARLEKALEKTLEVSQNLIKSQKSSDDKIKGIEKQLEKLSKQLETAEPADNSTHDGDEKKLGEEYVDNETGTEDGQENDNEGEDDEVHMEEKSKAVKGRQITKTPYPVGEGQTQSLSSVLKSMQGNPILEKARELGGTKMDEVVRLVKANAFGMEPRHEGYGQFYPIN